MLQQVAYQIIPYISRNIFLAFRPPLDPEHHTLTTAGDIPIPEFQSDDLYDEHDFTDMDQDGNGTSCMHSATEMEPLHPYYQ